MTNKKKYSCKTNSVAQNLKSVFFVVSGKTGFKVPGAYRVVATRSSVATSSDPVVANTAVVKNCSTATHDHSIHP